MLVFHGVVQPGGGQYLRAVGDSSDDSRDLAEMDAIGLICVFAPLILVDLAGKLHRLVDKNGHGGHGPLFCKNNACALARFHRRWSMPYRSVGKVVAGPEQESASQAKCACLETIVSACAGWPSFAATPAQPWP